MVCPAKRMGHPGPENLITNMAGIGLVLNVVRNRSVLNVRQLTPQTHVSGKYVK